MIQCYKCSSFKLHTDFSKTAASKPGTCFCVCRECCNKTARYYRSKPDFREKERAWARTRLANQTPEQRAKRIAGGSLCRRVTRWWVELANRAVQRCEKAGIKHDIDPDFVLELFERQQGKCYWLGVPLVPSLAKRDPQRPSLDRLDCSRGYTKDNVVLTCKFANIGRQDTPVERFVQFLVEAGIGGGIGCLGRAA